MKAKHVVLDLDETLADITTGWLQALKPVTGIHLTRADLTQYNMSSFFPQMNTTQMLANALQNRVLENATPLVNARLALQHLQNHDITVTILTARGWHPDAKRLTQRWLTKHQLPYSQLFIVPWGANKGQYLRQQVGHGIDAFIDDHVDNVRQVKQALPGINTLLLDQPWNQKHTDLRRVSSVFSALPFLL